MAHSWRYLNWLQLNDLYIVGFQETIQEVEIIGRGYGEFDNLQSAFLFLCRNLDLHQQQS